MLSRSQWPRGLRRRSAARSPAEIVGSNPTWGMDICEFWVLCVVKYSSLRRADLSSRGVPPTVLRRCVWSRNLVNVEAMAQWRMLPQTKKKNAVRSARQCTEQSNVESTTRYRLCTPSTIHICIHLYYCRSHPDINLGFYVVVLIPATERTQAVVQTFDKVANPSLVCDNVSKQPANIKYGLAFYSYLEQTTS